jgi:hypothetical protein
MGRSLLARARWWGFVGGFVLVTFLSACPGADGFHLEIFGDDSAIGAEVVDSKVRGTMELVPGVGDIGPSAQFSLSLPHGRHVLEFRRTGFETVRMEIEVPTASEHYLHVKMKRESR